MKNKLNQKGFTAIELMMAIVILLPLFTAVVLTFIRATQLNSIASHISEATRECRNQLTQIETTPFSQIFANYNNSTFDTPQMDGMGVVYVDNTDPDFVAITLSFSWKENNGRILGEDTDLDGNLDAGEDINGNGELDSIVEMSAVIYDI